MLLSEAIQEFLEHLKVIERAHETIRAYRNVLTDFQGFMEKEFNGKVYLDEVHLDHLETYIRYRKTAGDKPVSRNRALYVFRSFYGYLQKRDLVIKDISRNLEPAAQKQVERVHLTQNELRQLLETIDEPIIRTAAYTLAYTGMRISELCNLCLQDVDLENKTLHIIDGKGGKNRTLPISNKLLPLLEEYLQEIRPAMDSERFFVSKRAKRISPYHVNRCLKDAAAQLGWKKHVTAHVLRHTFASSLVRKNARLPVIQRLLGHSDLRVTGNYIHQHFSDLQDAVDSLD